MLKPVKRTMKAASAVRERTDGAEFIKPGELVDVRFIRGQSPSLAARRILTLLLSVAAENAWRDVTHRITKKQIRSSHKSNERIANWLDEVAAIRYKVESISSRGRAAIERSGLFELLVEETGEGDESWVEWRFSKSARGLFGNSEQYAQINRAALFAFESKYSLTLYELGCMYSGRHNPVWRGDLETLRDTLGIEKGKLKNWSDMRRFVLEQAKTEINHLAHFYFDWVEMRKNRKLIEIQLTFYRKQSEDIDAAANELERPKVGRKARQKGMVEQISAQTQEIRDTIDCSLGSQTAGELLDDEIIY